jgi:hypothetical protein
MKVLKVIGIGAFGAYVVITSAFSFVTYGDLVYRIAVETDDKNMDTFDAIVPFITKTFKRSEIAWKTILRQSK